MKRNTLISFILVTLAMAGVALAQRGTAQTTTNGKNISIDYGRPSLQGRDMLGRLPVGQSWRMGMNAATTLSTEAPLRFAEVTVPAGTHTLTLKRVSEQAFHLVVTPESGEALEIPVRMDKLDSPVETLTINLDSTGGNQGRFSLAWGTLGVAADFTVE